MSIDASLVKTLREQTGAGLMDCKRALIDSKGDLEAAKEAMRVSGLAKAEKKAGRIAAEGVICIKVSDDGKRAIILEINSETDFVARGDDFKAFCELVTQKGLDNAANSIDALMALDEAGETLAQRRDGLVSKLGENIQVRRVTLLESPDIIGAYAHGTRIGVIAALTGASNDLAKDICMHVAASQPVAISANDIPAEVLAKEKEIFVAQAKESGKPDNIIEKMVTGRINKFVNEISLHGQAFVKNPDMQVSQLLKEANAEVLQFIRYEVGEGIEKRQDDFAKEVMEQVKGS